MREFRLALAATHDLEDIEAYIAQDNAAAAEGVINNIEAACQLVADHPGVGHEIELGVMSFPVGSYLTDSHRRALHCEQVLWLRDEDAEVA